MVEALVVCSENMRTHQSNGRVRVVPDGGSLALLTARLRARNPSPPILGREDPGALEGVVARL